MVLEEIEPRRTDRLLKRTRVYLAISVASIAISTGFRATAQESDCVRSASRPLSISQIHLLESQLRSLNLKKAEFERQADFEARRTKELARIPELQADGEIAFAIALPWKFGSYDADSQTLTFDAFGDFVHFGTNLFTADADGPFDAILLQQQATRGRYYLGENAFGATTAVKSQSVIAFGVAYPGTAQLIPATGLRIPLSIEEGKSEKTDLELVLVGRPIAPYLGELTSFSSPTLDDPTDITLKVTAVVVTPVCAVVRSIRSGRVFTVSRAAY